MNRHPQLWLPGDLKVTGRNTDLLARFMYQVKRGKAMQPIAGGASFSDDAEVKILGHAVGKLSWTMPAAVGLALCTTVPTDASLGTNIVEATGYTGYLRITVAAAAFASAVSGTPSSIANNGTLTGAACTGGSATIIGWALCDSTTVAAGNVIVWGTCTSTVISPTQTPPTIATGALSVTLD